MSPAKRSLAGLFIAALLATLTPFSAVAEAPSTVLLLASPEPGEPGPHDLQRLRLAMEAHLSAHAVTVVLLQSSPADAPVLAEAAGIAAVTWLQDDTIHMVAPLLGREPTVRHVPPTDEGWPARCELMAAMLLSELTPILTGDLPAQPAVADLRQPPAEVSTAPTRPRVVPAALIGYAPELLSIDGPYLHGIDLGAGVAIGHHLEITLATALVECAPLDGAGAEARLRRWPLRLGVCASVPVSLLDLGLVAGPILEIWRVQGLDEPATDERTSSTQVAPGLGLAFQLRVRATTWLSPFVTAGIDIHASNHRFLYRGTPILERAATQPRLVVGVRFTPGR